jgi:protein phosphatase
VCQKIVRGNWDDAILEPPDERVEWYRQQVGAERLAYLATLPNVIDFWMSGKRVRLYHASEESVYKRIYASHPYEAHQAMFTNTPFTGFDEPAPDIVGYGDIHTAYMLTFHGVHRLLFNAGSVGNPLDMPLASYTILNGVLDSRTESVFSLDFVRVPFDIEQEIADARRVGVPDVDAYAIELRTSVYRGMQKQAAE